MSPVARSGLLRDARQARLAQLELRHADHVLHAHAHGEMAGELADEGAVGARPADEAAHAREIALGVGLVLVVGEALDAFGEDGVGFGWEGGERGVRPCGSDLVRIAGLACAGGQTRRV